MYDSNNHHHAMDQKYYVQQQQPSPHGPDVLILSKEKPTTAGGTSKSSVSAFSNSAAESQSIFSLLEASFTFTPVSVTFAYKDLLGFFFGDSTYQK